jgi:hypothetical protein
MIDPEKDITFKWFIQLIIVLICWFVIPTLICGFVCDKMGIELKHENTFPMCGGENDKRYSSSKS